jgi:hypothetical protein
VEERGAFACYGPRWEQFAAVAGWAGESLPEGSAVMSRKPRLFYVLGGVPSRTFPFDPSPGAQLDAADGVGARYVVLDQVDGLSTRYVGGAIRAAPGAWCVVRGFGQGQGIGTQLLGILPPEARSVGSAADGEIRVGRCPADYVASAGDVAGAYSSSRIPLLERLDP